MAAVARFLHTLTVKEAYSPARTVAENLIALTLASADGAAISATNAATTIAWRAIRTQYRPSRWANVIPEHWQTRR
jgi:hypothetical protein